MPVTEEVLTVLISQLISSDPQLVIYDCFLSERSSPGTKTLNMFLLKACNVKQGFGQTENNPHTGLPGCHLILCFICLRANLLMESVLHFLFL
jgi:hypothetical protein